MVSYCVKAGRGQIQLKKKNKTFSSCVVNSVVHKMYSLTAFQNQQRFLSFINFLTDYTEKQLPNKPAGACVSYLDPLAPGPPLCTIGIFFFFFVLGILQMCYVYLFFKKS